MRIFFILLMLLICISCKVKEKENTISKGEKVKEILVSIMSETQLGTAIIYKVVEHMPHFKACDPATLDKNEAKKCSDFVLMDYIMKNLSLPPDAKENGQTIKA
jgi:hypothetical protein